MNNNNENTGTHNYSGFSHNTETMSRKRKIPKKYKNNNTRTKNIQQTLKNRLFKKKTLKNFLLAPIRKVKEYMKSRKEKKKLLKNFKDFEHHTNQQLKNTENALEKNLTMSTRKFLEAKNTLKHFEKRDKNSKKEGYINDYAKFRIEENKNLIKNIEEQLSNKQKTLKTIRTLRNTRRPLTRKIKNFLKKPFRSLINKYKTKRSQNQALQVFGRILPKPLIERIIEVAQKMNAGPNERERRDAIAFSKTLLHNYDDTLKRAKNKVYLFLREIINKINKDTNLKQLFQARMKHLEDELEKDKKELKNKDINTNLYKHAKNFLKEGEALLLMIKQEAKKTDFEVVKKKLLKFKEQMEEEKKRHQRNSSSLSSSSSSIRSRNY